MHAMLMKCIFMMLESHLHYFYMDSKEFCPVFFLSSLSGRLSAIIDSVLFQRCWPAALFPLQAGTSLWWANNSQQQNKTALTHCLSFINPDSVLTNPKSSNNTKGVTVRGFSPNVCSYLNAKINLWTLLSRSYFKFKFVCVLHIRAAVSPVYNCVLKSFLPQFSIKACYVVLIETCNLI